MEIDDLISQLEAAKLRNVSPPRISHLIKRNRLEVFMIAGKPFVSRTQVLALQSLPGGRRPKVKSDVLIEKETTPSNLKEKEVNDLASGQSSLKRKRAGKNATA